MRISFNQPTFIPWGGFFARLMSSDRMVLLDDTALARGFTFVNRNRLKGPEGEIWITVPLKRKGRGVQKIKDLEIYEKDRWKNKFLATLRHYYGHSVYFKPVVDEIQNAVDKPGPNFLDLALALLNILKVNFAIANDMTLQSELKITGKGTPLLVSIASRLRADEAILPHGSEKAVERALFERAGIKPRFLRYAPPQYPQFWGNFRLNLSALDLLLCCGPEGRAVIERGISFYDPP
ncbi:MAG: WbqC family protein [Candidatus Aminicenantales bacterium]